MDATMISHLRLILRRIKRRTLTEKMVMLSKKRGFVVDSQALTVFNDPTWK